MFQNIWWPYQLMLLSCTIRSEVGDLLNRCTSSYRLLKNVSCANSHWAPSIMPLVSIYVAIQHALTASQEDYMILNLWRMLPISMTSEVLVSKQQTSPNGKSSFPWPYWRINKTTSMMLLAQSTFLITGLRGEEHLLTRSFILILE